MFAFYQTDNKLIKITQLIKDKYIKLIN